MFWQEIWTQKFTFIGSDHPWESSSLKMVHTCSFHYLKCPLKILNVFICLCSILKTIASSWTWYVNQKELAETSGKPWFMFSVALAGWMMNFHSLCVPLQRQINITFQGIQSSATLEYCPNCDPTLCNVKMEQKMWCESGIE